MTLMSLHCLLAILVIIAPLVVVAEIQGASPSPGDEQEWLPIIPIDPNAKKMVKFAVSEYNKESGKKFKLKSVIGGFQKAVPVGQLWRLYIAGKDTKSKGIYEIIVYDPFPAGSNWQLVSFKQVKK